MSRGSPQASKLVFCRKTSLEIAHSFNDARTDATRSPLSALPKHPPSDLALEQIAGRLSAATPPTRFSFPAHLLFHGGAHHKQTSLRLPHRCTSFPKGRHFLKVAKNVYAVSTNFALCQMADETKEMLDLLLLLWEACGTYRTDLTWMDNAYDTPRFMAPERFGASYAMSVTGLLLPERRKSRSSWDCPPITEDSTWGYPK